MLEDEESSGDDQRIKLTFKILLLGDSAVGKTSLLTKYVNNTFQEQHIATIGVEYKDKYIIKNDFNIRLQIWDTAGQERFHSISKNLYRGTNGVLFVYDITSKESFDNLKHWIKEFQDVEGDIKGVILGNKYDLKEERVIQEKDVINFSEQYQMPYLETSAKDNINVKEGFELMVDELLKGKNQDFIIERFSRKTKNDLSVETHKSHSKKKRKKDAVKIIKNFFGKSLIKKFPKYI